MPVRFPLMEGAATMIGPKQRWTCLSLLSALALLGSAARAADDIPSFKKRGDQEKKFISQVAVAVLKAAHPTGKNPSLDRYEIKEDEPKKGRTQLEIKAKFKGKVSNKEYV